MLLFLSLQVGAIIREIFLIPMKYPLLSQGAGWMKGWSLVCTLGTVRLQVKLAFCSIIIAVRWLA